MNVKDISRIRQVYQELCEVDVYGVVYKLTNINNQKCYIGQTVNFRRRMNEYRNHEKNGQAKLDNAIGKYGWDSFEIEIIDRAMSKNELDSMERKWISDLDTVNCGYNLMDGGQSSGKHSEESKKKMRENMLGAKNHAYGKTLTEEHREKIRLAGLGRKKSDESKEKSRQSKLGANNPMYGKTGPASHMYGKNHTAEAKEKNRLAHLGKKDSDETKEKKRLARKIYPFKDSDGNIYNTWDEAALKFEVSKHTIGRILNHKPKNRKGIVLTRLSAVDASTTPST